MALISLALISLAKLVENTVIYMTILHKQLQSQHYNHGKRLKVEQGSGQHEWYDGDHY